MRRAEFDELYEACPGGPKKGAEIRISIERFVSKDTKLSCLSLRSAKRGLDYVGEIGVYISPEAL